MGGFGPCPPPFFSQFEFTSSSNPPPVLHRSKTRPPRLHPFPESEVRYSVFDRRLSIQQKSRSQVWGCLIL
ncbi:hypothetical protein V6Z11_D11G221700 [Gossypium hirsutum]